jgi:hypothetical protein
MMLQNLLMMGRVVAQAPAGKELTTTENDLSRLCYSVDTGKAS